MKAKPGVVDLLNGQLKAEIERFVMTVSVQAVWSRERSYVIETRTAAGNGGGRTRLDVLTEDTLTAEEAGEIERRLQNPSLLPSRPARRVVRLVGTKTDRRGAPARTSRGPRRSTGPFSGPSRAEEGGW